MGLLMYVEHQRPSVGLLEVALYALIVSDPWVGAPNRAVHFSTSGWITVSRDVSRRIDANVFSLVFLQQ